MLKEVKEPLFSFRNKILNFDAEMTSPLSLSREMFPNATVSYRMKNYIE